MADLLTADALVAWRPARVAMTFSLLVELLNLRRRHRGERRGGTHA
jgi:hypothetical protein